MKKLSLIMLALFFAACNGDDERVEECENRLWELTGGPETYFATYGPSEAEAGTVIVDQSTFEHYSALGNVNDGSLCWEGTQ